MNETLIRIAPLIDRPLAFRLSGRGVIFAAIWLCLALLIPAPSCAQEALATGWRMAARDGGHRFVMDLSEKVSFQVFNLADPDRIVVDVTPVAWRLGPAEAVGPVRALRTGRLEAGVGRLVLDLAQPARVVASRLIEPRDGQRWRLILDLETVQRETFLRSVGPPGRTIAATPNPSAGSAPVLTNASATPLGVQGGAQVTGQGSAAQVAAMRPPAQAKPAERRLPVIVIDAGHGGQDPGAISVGGAYEKHITLDAALELRRQLQATGRYRVLLTRADDRFIPLRERVAIARGAQADLFISIHADSIGNPRQRGLTIYTVSDTASDREAEALAQKENKADVIAGVNLGGETPQVANILIDLTQRETKNHSVTFAALAVEQLSKVSRTVDQAHRFAGFLVLTAADVPSVLIELGYLSNRDDERELQNPVHRRRLAESITTAVDRYFSPQGAVNVASLSRGGARKP
jgi:N-acetylmuramoyl-L-alanine amidase